MPTLNNTERPTVVTVIGWFLIITSALPLLTTLPMLMMPGDIKVGALRGLQAAGQNVATLLFFNALLTVSGVGILKGLKWARILLFAVWPGRLVAWVLIGLATSAIPMFAMGAVGYIVFIVLLTRPEAAAFFKQRS